MMFPTIHLNGSSPEYLLESARYALDSLRAAVLQVEGTAPNGRDYYPQGDGAIKTAVCEHASRIERLRSVIAELEELAEHITDTRGSR